MAEIKIAIPLSTCKKLIVFGSELRVEPNAVKKFEKLILSFAKDKALIIQQNCAAENRKTIRSEDLDNLEADKATEEAAD